MRPNALYPIFHQLYSPSQQSVLCADSEPVARHQHDSRGCHEMGGEDLEKNGRALRPEDKDWRKVFV